MTNFIENLELQVGDYVLNFSVNKIGVIKELVADGSVEVQILNATHNDWLWRWPGRLVVKLSEEELTMALLAS